MWPMEKDSSKHGGQAAHFEPSAQEVPLRCNHHAAPPLHSCLLCQLEWEKQQRGAGRKDCQCKKGRKGERKLPKEWNASSSVQHATWFIAAVKMQMQQRVGRRVKCLMLTLLQLHSSCQRLRGRNPANCVWQTSCTPHTASGGRSGSSQDQGLLAVWSPALR